MGSPSSGPKPPRLLCSTVLACMSMSRSLEQSIAGELQHSELLPSPVMTCLSPCMRASPAAAGQECKPDESPASRQPALKQSVSSCGHGGYSVLPEDKMLWPAPAEPQPCRPAAKVRSAPAAPGLGSPKANSTSKLLVGWEKTRQTSLAASVGEAPLAVDWKVVCVPLSLTVMLVLPGSGWYEKGWSAESIVIISVQPSCSAGLSCTNSTACSAPSPETPRS